MKIDFDYHQIFDRSLQEMSPLELLKTDAILQLPRDTYDIGYRYNSHGYRCENFTNQEILTLGCSQTFGFGQYIDRTWPYILSNQMKMEYANLAKGGDSAPAQVAKAFQFFKEFYNPKYIFAVFPLFRLEFPLVEKILTRSKNSAPVEKDKKRIAQHFIENDHNSIPKIVQSPYNLSEILPVEVPIFYSMMFIRMLEQYCESNNIVFFWTTYEVFDSKKEYEKKFKEMINSNHYVSSFTTSVADFESEFINCHLEFANAKSFKVSADKTHIGFHYHLHISELFYELYKNSLK